MTPEEFVKLSNEYQEEKSICDGLRYDLVESIFKKKYIQAQLLVHKFQEQMKQGKHFYFKWYGSLNYINQFISAQNPILKMKIEDTSVQTAERFHVEIKVEYINKRGEKGWMDVPSNGIFEHIELEKIDPYSYEF